MADNQVVTELIITSEGAKVGADVYSAAMAKAATAALGLTAANDRVQASIASQTVMMTGAAGRQVSQWNRLAAAADPVIAAQQKLAQATNLMTNGNIVARVGEDERIAERELAADDVILRHVSDFGRAVSTGGDEYRSGIRRRVSIQHFH